MKRIIIGASFLILGMFNTYSSLLLVSRIDSKLAPYALKYLNYHEVGGCIDSETCTTVDVIVLCLYIFAPSLAHAALGVGLSAERLRRLEVLIPALWIFTFGFYALSSFAGYLKPA